MYINDIIYKILHLELRNIVIIVRYTQYILYKITTLGNTFSVVANILQCLSIS